MNARFNKLLLLLLTFLLLCALASCANTTTLGQSETDTDEDTDTDTDTDEGDNDMERKDPINIELSQEELRDKIEGGWIGEMAGVAWGAPTEFCYAARQVPISAIPKWKPEMINDAFGQDDLYVEIPFIDTMRKKGVDCKPKYIADAFSRTSFALWHANGMARDNLRAGIPYPDSGSYLNNYHSDDIDWQIECDFLGMIYPGQIDPAANRAFELGHIMNYGDGAYGGVFVTAMHSAAFTATSVEEICREGIAAIPEGTQFRALVDDVMAYYKEGHTFDESWKHLQNTWGGCDICPELPGPSNIDAKFNSGYVLMALLYGECDLEKTIVLATRCGQDSDCNPSTVGSILGNYLGASKIDDKFKSALDRTGKKFSYTTYTYEDCVNINYSLAEKQLAKSGAVLGEDGVWRYTVQPGKNTVPFEQWPDGVYIACKASASGSRVKFGELRTYTKNEEISTFSVDMGDGTVIRDVFPTSYVYEKAGEHEITFKVVGEKGSVTVKKLKVKTTEDGNTAANDKIVVCSVTAPFGGGSKDASVICDGNVPKAGASDAAQYDTYILRDPVSNPDKVDYIGYVFASERKISEVVFTEGNHFGNGGWFKNGTLRVEVLVGDKWTDAPMTSTPAYPNSNNQSAFGAPYETYNLKLSEAVTCKGVRLIGTAGGSAGFISASEIDIK